MRRRRAGRARSAPEVTSPASWIVLKFGGSSVSTLSNWNNIARIVAERRGRLLDAAVGHAHEAELHIIEERHRQLAAELGVPLGEEVERLLAEVREIAAGVALVRDVSERTRARVMASGELMATHLGTGFLAR